MVQSTGASASSISAGRTKTNRCLLLRNYVFRVWELNGTRKQELIVTARPGNCVVPGVRGFVYVA